MQVRRRHSSLNKCSLLKDSCNFSEDKAVDKVSSGSGGAISGVEVRAEAVCICVIDDCLDADVPLVEMTFHGLLRHVCLIIRQMFK